MKKVLAICMMFALLATMSVSAFAATNGFVSSPSENSAPTIVEFDPADENCTATLNITAYGDKHTLPDALRTLLEQAYNSIANADDLTKLNAALADLVKKEGYDSTKLAVSDLFDIHPSDCEFHDGHLDFDVTLSADTLTHFVALLHMNKDGVWELVADAKVTNNGEHLEFSVETLSPFAIIVNTGDAPAPAPNYTWVYIAVAAVVVIGAAVAVVYFVKRKKAI